MGRILLAGQPDQWLDGYLASARLLPLTRHTITDPDRLRTELATIRERGWALVDQELEEGLRSLAAPLHDGDGKVVAAINVSAHASRGTPETIAKDLLPHLLEAARLIDDDLLQHPQFSLYYASR